MHRALAQEERKGLARRCTASGMAMIRPLMRRLMAESFHEAHTAQVMARVLLLRSTAVSVQVSGVSGVRVRVRGNVTHWHRRSATRRARQLAGAQAVDQRHQRAGRLGPPQGGMRSHDDHRGTPGTSGRPASASSDNAPPHLGQFWSCADAVLCE